MDHGWRLCAKCILATGDASHPPWTGAEEMLLEPRRAMVRAQKKRRVGIYVVASRQRARGSRVSSAVCPPSGHACGSQTEQMTILLLLASIPPPAVNQFHSHIPLSLCHLLSTLPSASLRTSSGKTERVIPTLTFYNSRFLVPNSLLTRRAGVRETTLVHSCLACSATSY